MINRKLISLLVYCGSVLMLASSFFKNAWLNAFAGLYVGFTMVTITKDQLYK